MSESSESTSSLLPLVCATAGSVDDGKSTLIGRLLYDAKVLMTDQIEHVAQVSRRRGLERTDLALLTDGLRAEREQGITIDVAWRYFATPKRRFVLADSPGHVQYTRNMVTAASHADVAIVLVDARRGVTEQTRRHLFVARLLGVSGITIAINKMDQVGFAFDRFAALRDEVVGYLDRVDLPRRPAAVTVLPIAALHGDNVVEPSRSMPWHDGTTLLAHLEAHPKAGAEVSLGARFAVQTVIRPQSASHPDFRGYAGRLTSAALAVGQRVRVLPSGLASTVREILSGGESIDRAEAGESIVVRLDTDLDVGRGDWLVADDRVLPSVTRALTADLAWMSTEPGAPGTRCVLKSGTREVPASIVAIESRYDVVSGRAEGDEARGASATRRIALNDLARVRIETNAPIAVDRYRDARASGSFLLIDAASSETLAGGMVC